MSSDGDTPRPKHRHFVWFNRANDVYMRYLAEVEFKALMKLGRHADAEGITFPSIAKLASDIPCTERAVYKAIETMKAMGLVEVAEQGGGRGNLTKWRLLTPETLNPRSGIKKSETLNPRSLNSEPRRAETLNPRSLNSEPRRAETLNPRSLNSEPRRAETLNPRSLNSEPRRAPSIEEQPNNSLREQHQQQQAASPRSAAADAVVLTAARQRIYDYGIGDPTATTIVTEFPSLTPQAIDAIMGAMSPTAGPGARVNAIRANAERVIEETAKAERVRQHRRAQEAETQRRLVEYQAKQGELDAQIGKLMGERTSIAMKRDTEATIHTLVVRKWMESRTDAEIEARIGNHRSSQIGTINRDAFLSVATVRRCSVMTQKYCSIWWEELNPADAVAYHAKVAPLESRLSAIDAEGKELREQKEALVCRASHGIEEPEQESNGFAEAMANVLPSTEGLSMGRYPGIDELSRLYPETKRI